jgi:hypothetical protein
MFDRTTATSRITSPPPAEDDPVDADQPDPRGILPQSRHELAERPQPQAKP